VFVKNGLFVTVFFVLITPAFLFSEVGRNRELTRLAISERESFTARPSNFRDSEHFYQSYFTASDSQILNQYVERWQYQEMQIPFALTSWNYEHLSVLSGPSGSSLYEGDARREFANHALKIRLTRAVEAYLASPERPAGIRKAGSAIHSFRALQVSSATGNSGKLKLAYDIFTDSSKVEYFSPRFEWGVYHSRLLSSLVGANPFEGMAVRMKTKLNGGLPSLMLHCPLNGSQFESGLEKSLSKRLDAIFMSSHPLGDASVPRAYHLTFLLRF